MPSNKKQKTSHGPPNNNGRNLGWTPAQIQADPKLYIRQIPNVLRKETPYASAALLGLSSSSLPMHVITHLPARDPSKAGIVTEIGKKCPGVFKNNPTLFRKLLMESDTTIINLLLSGTPPLFSAVSLDLELANLAVRKAPLCYLHLPPNLLKKCNDVDKKKLESGFHKLLVSGDATTIDLLLTGPPPMISKVDWTRDLALQAVLETPRLYQHLPTSLKTKDTELALTAMLSPNADVKTIVDDVNSCCSYLFSDPTALKEMFGKASNELIITVLTKFSDTIVWDHDMAELARSRCPASSSFLPASFRSDNVDAQYVMASLLKLGYSSDTVAIVDDAIATCPEFFADRDAVHQLFLAANSRVVSQVVKRLSSSLPWDKELMLLAPKRCITGFYSEEDNLIYDELTRMHKGSIDCKQHLPLGMLLSYGVKESIRVWPEFLSSCSCALVRDDSVMLQALDFIGPTLLKTEQPTEFNTFFRTLVRQVKMDFQSRGALENLLKCIHVAGGDRGGGRLDVFQGGDETSIALKRTIAEFLGAPIRKTKRVMNKIALKLVYCLLTLPIEFGNEIGSLEEMRQYELPFRVDAGTFYCKWCCTTLTRLETIYSAEDGDENSLVDSDYEDSDKEVSDKDLDEDSGWDSDEDSGDSDEDRDEDLDHDLDAEFDDIDQEERDSIAGNEKFEL